ncbi:MAG: DUF1573 domain-containing protein [Planctomycetales bacterium]|nr:DUF1573 domain-containing protein [Planctomycetales bacterium]NIM10004.1 DUF1573 domain-containing protein [Planctomycetales bacterium]NIN09444.1 DUF1573 domain-containing protein [Planctomycetales bacterium]NIN78553.1 DUF1573 domain-containing protein [Planctomycetales bacterium]NIO35745.1 DUF1573 domain-containing protein [Planctomycetales bacterium]
MFNLTGKKWSPLFFVVLLLPAAASAEDVSRTDWAEKMFDHLEFDFESLARGSKAEHRFKIRNLYRETIQIASVSSSCGCTDPRVLKETLESGEETELIAEFNTIAFEGSHKATITVRFAEPYQAEVRLHIRGYVRKDVVLTPGRVELGLVDSETGAVKSVKVAYAGRPDWQITDVRSSNSDFEVELSPPLRAGGRVEYEMVFRLKKGAASGYLNDQLFLVTNDQSNRMIPLAIEGRVRSGLTVSPASLHLGVLRPGQKVTKRLVVRGTQPFRIIDIDCEDGTNCFTFDSSDTPRKVHLIPVTFTAPAHAGHIVEKIKIVTQGVPGSLPTVVAQAEVRD